LTGGDVPIFFIFDKSIFENEKVTREEFLNAVEQSERSWDVAESEIFLKSGKIQTLGNVWSLKNGLKLRCKENTAGLAPDIEGLFPHAVAAKNQALAVLIPDGQREHSAQALE
jgi:hypothetical protein